MLYSYTVIMALGSISIGWPLLDKKSTMKLIPMPNSLATLLRRIFFVSSNITLGNDYLLYNVYIVFKRLQFVSGATLFVWLKTNLTYTRKWSRLFWLSWWWEFDFLKTRIQIIDYSTWDIVTVATCVVRCTNLTEWMPICVFLLFSVCKCRSLPP